MSTITEQLNKILLDHRDAVNRGASINGLDEARTRLQALMLRERLDEWETSQRSTVNSKRTTVQTVARERIAELKATIRKEGAE